MSTRKDFSQVALDVVRRATGELPKAPAPAPEPKKQAAPKVTQGAAKKTAKRS